MVNYIVDDLNALLDRLRQEGVKIDAKRMNESYGRFACIYDLDGNKVELWRLQSPKARHPSFAFPSKFRFSYACFQ
jgi:predicted enzyme related to lactoylglutathione lyase